MVTMIAAAAQNNALGKDNALLWHLPDDFKRFRELTTGHYIVMGRKTFESFPKPLPNRTHVVISRQPDYQPDGCIVLDSLEAAMEVCPKDQDVYVIGGGQIYALALPLADRIELTRVQASFEADAFFPEIDPQQWELVAETFHPKDERHAFGFSYQTFERK